MSTVQQHALDILARLSEAAPVSLEDAPGSPGEALATGPGTPLSPRLWSRDAQTACLGIRVTTPPGDVTALARRLAASAAERGILPVILTTLDSSGFERLGFRVERLSGTTP